MIYPKLPEPVILDGRMVYTSGQMRQFAKEAVELNTDDYCDAPYQEQSLSSDNPFGDIFGDIFTKGMK